MTYRKKTGTRKKSKKKKMSAVGMFRLCSAFFVILVLLFSVCAVGYVIFFRTVFAQEILPAIKKAIVFEEPDPPVHLEVVVEEKKNLNQILPKVAIIIDDMGYHESIDRELLALPFEMTYSFLPFAPYTSELEWSAYRSGKTVFLHLPLEPKGAEWDPGPGALFLKDKPNEQNVKFDKCLNEVPHAVGVNNHMGSLFTADKRAMKQVMKKIDDEALYFIDSITSPASVGLQIAQELGVKSAKRHVFLDNIQEKDKICVQLRKLVDIAEKGGVGIGIGHPYRATVEALSTCAESYSSRVQYVSIKDVLR